MINIEPTSALANTKMTLALAKKIWKKILPQLISVVGAGLLYGNIISLKQKTEAMLCLFLQSEVLHLGAS